MSSVEEVEKLIAQLNARIIASSTSPGATHRDRQRLYKELRLQHMRLNQLRRNEGAHPTDTPDAPETPPIIRPIARVPPRRPAVRRIQAELTEKRASELEERFKSFSELVKETRLVVDDCFGGDSAATQTDEGVAERRRKLVEDVLKDAEVTRQSFLDAYERASRDATAQLPDLIAFKRSELEARGRIRKACEYDSVKLRNERALRQAQRCTEDEASLPESVRAFLLGRKPYEDFIDRRVYCFTGPDMDDTPGLEDSMRFPPLIKAQVFPPKGAPIGPDGFEVAVKEGRYIGIGVREDDGKQRRRIARNGELISSISMAAVESVSVALKAAQQVAISILDKGIVLKNGFVESIAAAQRWIIEMLLRFSPKNLAYRVLPALVGKGTFLAARALSRLPEGMFSTALRRPVFLLTAMASIAAYRHVAQTGDTQSKQLALRTLVSVLKSNSYGLLSRFLAPFGSGGSTRYAFGDNVTLDDTMVSGDVVWPTMPVGSGGSITEQPPPFDLKGVLELLQSDKVSPNLNAFEEDIFGKELRANMISTLNDADSLIDDAFIKNLVERVDDPKWSERFSQQLLGVLDPTEIGYDLMWQVPMALVPAFFTGGGSAAISLAALVKGVAVGRVVGRTTTIVGNELLQSEQLRNALSYVTNSTTFKGVSTVIDLSEAANSAKSSLNNVVKNTPLERLVEMFVGVAAQASTTNTIVPVPERWTNPMRDAVGRLVPSS